MTAPAACRGVGVFNTMTLRVDVRHQSAIVSNCFERPQAARVDDLDDAVAEVVVEARGVAGRIGEAGEIAVAS